MSFEYVNWIQLAQDGSLLQRRNLGIRNAGASHVTPDSPFITTLPIPLEGA